MRSCAGEGAGHTYAPQGWAFTPCWRWVKPPCHTLGTLRGQDAVYQTQAREATAGRCHWCLSCCRRDGGGELDGRECSTEWHARLWPNYGSSRSEMWLLGWCYRAEQQRLWRCHSLRWRDLREERLTFYCVDFQLIAGWQWAYVRKVAQCFNFKGKGERVREVNMWVTCMALNEIILTDILSQGSVLNNSQLEGRSALNIHPNPITGLCFYSPLSQNPQAWQKHAHTWTFWKVKLDVVTHTLQWTTLSLWVFWRNWWNLFGRGTGYLYLHLQNRLQSAAAPPKKKSHSLLELC